MSRKILKKSSKEIRDQNIENNKPKEPEKPVQHMTISHVVPPAREGTVFMVPGTRIEPKKIWRGEVFVHHMEGTNVVIGKRLVSKPGYPETESFITSHWNALPIYTKEREET